MQCPKCNSDQTQRLEVIFENGTQDVNTRSNSVGLASSRGGLGIGTATTTTTGKTQSLAAQRVAPPEKKKIAGPIFGIVFGVVCMMGGGGWLVFGLALACSCGYVFSQSSSYNKNTWPQLFKNWENSWYCNKCGTVYQD